MDELELGRLPVEMEVDDDRGLTWHVCIKKRDRINLEDVIKYAQSFTSMADRTGAVSKYKEAHTGMIFLNALLRHNPSKRFDTGSGSKSTTYFDHRNSMLQQNLGFNKFLQAWSGFYQSASVRFARLTVNVDSATAIYICPGTNFVKFAATLMRAEEHELEEILHNNPHQFKRSVTDKLKHVGFRTKHLKADKGTDTGNTYFTSYVFAFDFAGAVKYTFQRRGFSIGPNGEQIEKLVKYSIVDVCPNTNYDVHLLTEMSNSTLTRFMASN